MTMPASYDTDRAREPEWECPPSGVADQIKRWPEVEEGELVLFEAAMWSLERSWVGRCSAVTSEGKALGRVRLMRGGETRDAWVNAEDLTAVRRYVEG